MVGMYFLSLGSIISKAMIVCMFGFGPASFGCVMICPLRVSSGRFTEFKLNLMNALVTGMEPNDFRLLKPRALILIKYLQVFGAM